MTWWLQYYSKCYWKIVCCLNHSWLHLEHSYSSFKTQLGCHNYCKLSLKHLNLSLLAREALLPPLSSFFLYLRLLKQQKLVQYLLSTSCIPGTAEYTYCAYYLQQAPLHSSEQYEVVILFSHFTDRKTEGQRGNVISSWSHSSNWSLNLDVTPKPSPHSKPAWRLPPLAPSPTLQGLFPDSQALSECPGVGHTTYR